MSCFLITRPKAQSQELQSWIVSQGHTAYIAPMLDISYDSVPDINFAQYDALIITSTHAIESLKHNNIAAVFDIPVFTVGEVTKQATMSYGFKHVYTTEGGKGGLPELFQQYGKDIKTCLYLRAETISDGMEDILHEIDVEFDEQILYTAHPVESFSKDVQQALFKGDITHTVFTSSRSAAQFRKLVSGMGIDSQILETKALCMSEAVLRSLGTLKWKQVHIADTPVIKDFLLNCMEKEMAQNNTSKSLDNAVKIIDRFGGIRPMANKMGVPVTTVQGWKKRDTIPDDRVSDVISAAREHDIDLSDLTGANNNTESSSPEAARTPSNNDNVQTFEPKKQQPQTSKTTKETKMRNDDTISIMSAEDVRAEQKRDVKNYLWITAAVVGVGLFAMFTFNEGSAPQSSVNQSNLASLEQELDALNGRVGEVEARTSVLERFVPDDLQARLDVFQDQTNTLSAKVSEYGTQLEAYKQGVLNNPENAAQMAVLLERVNALQEQVEGRATVDTAMLEVQTIVANLQTQVQDLDAALAEQAQKSDSALHQIAGNITKDDIRAATMLIALTQLRDSLNRQDSFEQDLALLRQLAGPEDQQVQEAITRLAPYSEKGVLSVGGLQNQLKLLSNDIVSASLRGEDVSLSEKALARLNSIVSVKKDGEPVVATDTQKQVANAQSALDQGNIQEAVSILSQLEGPAAQQAQPFLESARGTLLAQSIQSQLGDSLIQKLKAASQGVGQQPIFIETVPAVPPQDPTVDRAPDPVVNTAPVTNDVTPLNQPQ